MVAAVGVDRASGTNIRARWARCVNESATITHVMRDSSPPPGVFSEITRNDQRYLGNLPTREKAPLVLCWDHGGRCIRSALGPGARRKRRRRRGGRHAPV